VSQDGCFNEKNRGSKISWHCPFKLLFRASRECTPFPPPPLHPQGCSGVGIVVASVADLGCFVPDPRSKIQYFVPDPGSENFFIPDPVSYVLCKKGVAIVNILFSCCLLFQGQVAQFHKDNISPKKGAGSLHPQSRGYKAPDSGSVSATLVVALFIPQSWLWFWSNGD
jgi:hypothetical protein